jgi:signal transduction histidine kinase
LQVQKLEAIGQLAAGIAHEINTPAQYIGDNMGFVQESFGNIQTVLDQYAQLLHTVKAGPVSPERIEEIEATIKQSQTDYLMQEIPAAIEESLEGLAQVTRIVQAMKEFSHPGVEGKTAININKAIESTITMSRNEWKYVADLETDFQPDLPLVSCLAGEFNQAVLNILINAAHAIAEVVEGSSEGKGKIKVTTRQDGDWVETRISDTGPGIPAEIGARVFDPFFTTKDVGQGTGQGLAIAYSVITEKHGGTIAFEAETGQGTTFIIRVPIESISEKLEAVHVE